MDNILVPIIDSSITALAIKLYCFVFHNKIPCAQIVEREEEKEPLLLL